MPVLVRCTRARDGRAFIHKTWRGVRARAVAPLLRRRALSSGGRSQVFISSRLPLARPSSRPSSVSVVGLARSSLPWSSSRSSLLAYAPSLSHSVPFSRVFPLSTLFASLSLTLFITSPLIPPRCLLLLFLPPDDSRGSRYVLPGFHSLLVSSPRCSFG